MARKREIAAETKRRTRKIITPTAFSVQVNNYIAKQNCYISILIPNSIPCHKLHPPILVKSI
ncbi:hypothetical protein [Desulfosporosinus sp. SB140]|uniref:hypothetical protein n=1 Tax=Desulfosporosinus paludis TaxID=3115649 RepID=UPI00388DCDDF